MNAAAIDENETKKKKWRPSRRGATRFWRCATCSTARTSPTRRARGACAREWGARISEEFYKQGDRERALGVPVAALNDRYAAGATNAAATTAANQIAFARCVVEPTLEGLMTIAPGAVGVMLDRLRKHSQVRASGRGGNGRVA